MRVGQGPQVGEAQEEAQEEEQGLTHRGLAACRLSSVTLLSPAPALTVAPPPGVRNQHNPTWTSPLDT